VGLLRRWLPAVGSWRYVEELLRPGRSWLPGVLRLLLPLLIPLEKGAGPAFDQSSILCAETRLNSSRWLASLNRCVFTFLVGCSSPRGLGRCAGRSGSRGSAFTRGVPRTIVSEVPAIYSFLALI